jgi:hypothetical protein
MNRSAGRAPIMNCPLTAGTTFAANDDREKLSAQRRTDLSPFGSP